MSTYKAQTYAATLSAYLSAKYGHTYNWDEVNHDELGTRIGLAADAQDAEPTSDQPTLRVFAFTGDSGEIHELAEGNRETLSDTMMKAMANLPLRTRAVALWANATMRTIPDELADDMRHGADPDQPTMARIIRERGRRIDCQTVMVVGDDAQVLNMHTPHGTLTETAHNGNDQAQVGGVVADATRSLYMFAKWQDGIEQRVREAVAAEQATAPTSDLDDNDLATWRAWCAEYDATEGNNTQDNN